MLGSCALFPSANIGLTQSILQNEEPTLMWGIERGDLKAVQEWGLLT